MSSIPASQLVAVNPSVLTVGGSTLDIIGLILTTSTQVPVGAVQSFPDAPSVGDYFGASSQEASLAATYFSGFTGSSKLPGSLLFAQYNDADVPAYLRGGSVSGLTLAQLQAIAGTLTVIVDGVSRTAGALDLSAAASFSAAAATIETDLNAALSTIASFTGVIAGTTLTASAVTGVLAVGQEVLGGGVAADTFIIALGTGTGGAGTYIVSESQSVGSEAMTTEGAPVSVTYDSVSGAFVIESAVPGSPSTVAFATGTTSADLALTSATGAVLSQGADAATPSAFMDAIVAITTDWVTFMTAFDPDGGSGNTLKLEFADWKDSQNNRYGYVCWDTDVTPTVSSPATGSLGYLLDQNNDSGTFLIDGSVANGWDDTTGPDVAAFVCGAAASIDFEKSNGRVTFAFRQQDGLPAYVTSGAVALNLAGNPQAADRGNGYNFYGTYGSANSTFTWLQRGFVTGDFAWFDSYINQIWLNTSFQAALLNLQTNALSIPYNTSGAALIESALADPIAAGLSFGAYAPGAISASQAAQVNNDANAIIAPTLQTQGYYLQIGQASSASRAARTTPPCKFWYLDRGSVQAITLASVALQ